ncbi:MarR family transcriptional regulator [Halobacterium wangiae]|uniref:MarR family transcriptional regulator n=1 Tax=Halobacterium wangiae TaxID=2902623 RepID=UPI001E4DB82D|nr:MarR family transcriptional regulator [Halobacterium wangiae]
MSNSPPVGFADLPPSAKFVYHVLDQHEKLTCQALLEATELPESTLDRALDTLQNDDYVSVDRKSGDLRQVVIKVASSRTL